MVMVQWLGDGRARGLLNTIPDYGRDVAHIPKSPD
jgi:hypothetical protein